MNEDEGEREKASIKEERFQTERERPKSAAAQQNNTGRNRKRISHSKFQNEAPTHFAELACQRRAGAVVCGVDPGRAFGVFEG